MEQDKEPVIDEALYNRQVYVLGVEAMKKMSHSNVLIVGLSGLGCEIAKNLILAGVASVTLYDTATVTYNDLSSHFYLTEESIGKNRVAACIDALSELNTYVAVRAFSSDLNESSLQGFQVVVYVDHCTSKLEEVNGFCHNKGIKFISVESRGLTGSVFCDFGKQFEIYDVDGEDTVTCLVTAVTGANPAAITVHEENRHNLEDGQKVLITDVEGPSDLNDKEWEVTVTGPYTFTINANTTNLPRYIRGGYVKPIKTGIVKDFLPLKEALLKPEAVLTDFSKEQMPCQLHVFFMALHQFITEYGAPPAPYDDDQANTLINIAKNVIQKFPHFGPLQEEPLLKLAKSCSGNLSPMAAFLGGFAAQEVLKACSGKFSPLNQFMYFDAVEALPDPLPSKEDCRPTGTRYDGQIAVFGKQMQQVLLKHTNFLVGAGALGCELIKNFAMMGMGCSPEGSIIITDMDQIEKSNLSRQFLFRHHHIKSSKSTIAAQQAKGMNPALNVRAMEDKVAPETEGTFDDAFWEKVDGVTNALDNVQARLYVDSKCVYYRKPLMESGTLGTKGNVQVVAPFKTESYGSSRDPPEKSIPICTLKNFPNAIEHTIQWARDSFEGLFRSTAEDVNAYLTRPDFIQQLEKEPATKPATLENIYDAVVKDRPETFNDCIHWARTKFEEYFNNNIQQLLFNFPVDTITNSGERFWSGPKRPPTPVSFDAADPTHLDFVAAAAHLRAVNFGIAYDGANIATVAANVMVPDFVPRKANIQTEENEKPVEDTSKNSDEIMKRLPAPASIGLKMCPVEFEKDDDTNHHIDFITACSNLRARNYKIPEADKSKTKQIAGKIIPAMVTTTAMVTGLVCFEWYKLVQAKDLATYKNAFVNLALPFVTLAEPMPAPSAEYGGVKWTLWDRFDVDVGRDFTLKEFIDYFMSEHKLEINMISSGSSIVYSFFGAKAKLAERLKKPVSEVVKEVSKTEFPTNQKYINMEICCTYEDEDVDVPYVRYRFRHADK
jgi:ubiquitin-activating enzyme E1|mmetsp:Transcript_30594/g.51715  ORF Transcript_30594/g.51715 Transcript_30594/m.51715 type:complete len:1003 (+) Transcript_30594:83-3091(+)